jgi:hypothetical protein
MKRALGGLALAALVAGALNCGRDVGPVAGNLQVRLTSPNSGADSAIVLTITGPAALTSATAGAGLRVFAQPLGTTTRFALTGRLTTNTTILTIGVVDVSRLGQYAATIQGVAQPNFQLRTGLAGYLLSVIR